MRTLALITLLITAYNIFATLLDKSLSDIVEKKKLEECQTVFCPNRYTIDNIFIIRHFLNILCHDIDLYNIFVNYTQSFGSVFRNKIVEYLAKYKVPG
jgi:hypothetical protein